MKHRKLIFLVFLFLTIVPIIGNCQISLEDYLQHQQNEFMVLAPDSNELLISVKNLNKAANTFSNYFPEHDQSVNFLLAPNPQTLSNLEFSKLKNKYQNIKTFFTSESLSKATNTAETIYALNAGILLKQNSEAISVIALLPGNTVSDKNIKPGDQLLAINSQSVGRIHDVRSLYEKFEIGEVYTIKLKREGEIIEFKITKHTADSLPNITTGSENNALGKNQSTLTDKNPLSHEACHAYFIQHVAQKYPNNRTSIDSTGYGSDIIPDWLDEGIATLCENDALKNSRYKFLKKNFTSRYQLKELLEMAHPLAHLANNNAIASDGTFKVMKVESGDNIKTRLGIFYSQVLSFSEFLAFKSGAQIFSEITEFYADGNHEFEQFLANHSTLPDSISELEEQWIKWLNKNT